MIEAHIYPHVPATLYRPRVKFSLQYSLNGLGSIHLQFFFGESMLYLFLEVILPLTHKMFHPNFSASNQTNHMPPGSKAKNYPA